MIKSIIPQLPSLKLDRTIQFYKDIGFNLIEKFEDEEYAIMALEHHEIHFWPCDNSIIPQNSSCYITVDDIDAIHKTLESKLKNIDAPENKPWGMREMYVTDPDGNLLRFGQIQ